MLVVQISVVAVVAGNRNREEKKRRSEMRRYMGDAQKNLRFPSPPATKAIGISSRSSSIGIGVVGIRVQSAKCESGSRTSSFAIRIGLSTPDWGLFNY